MKETNQPNKSLSEKVLQRIQTTHLEMRPKAFFSFKIGAVIFMTILIGVTSAVLFNFILFNLGESGRSLLLEFGPRGYLSFLKFFPWLLLLVDLGSVIFLGWLVRHFKFGYRRPLLYMFIGGVIATGGVGAILYHTTDLNDRLEHEVGRSFYPSQFHQAFDDARHPPTRAEGVCRCVIKTIKDNIIVARDTFDLGTQTIVLPFDNYHATTTGLAVGDTIFVVGNAEDEVIYAFGVQKVN